MGFSPEFLDEIRLRLPVAEVISRRMRLTRRGREHLGLCPFHNEKTPSFTVNEEKGFFHCFGCGAHGDVVEFVMRRDGLSFPEAVERLAQEAGLEIPVATPEERAREKARHSLYDVVEAACAWFEAQLGSSRKARDYLEGRGLGKETIARFRLGHAPEGRRALKRALVAKGVPEDLQVKAGLLIKLDDGSESYDRFRNRVIFPIADRRGKVIAFGGRALGDDKAKYLNSPETPLFQKGRMLYAFAVARPAMHETGEAVVTEGYMDVIALHQAGFANAVAPLGTALTEAQIQELWRVVPEPVLCFDGDEAGRRASARAAERALPILAPGKSLRFATLPEGEDPDSLIASQGREAVRAVIASARPLSDVIWKMETAAHPVDTPERRADLDKRLESQARRIADRKVQEQYLRLFRDRLWKAFRASRGAAKEGRPGVLAQNEGEGWRSRTDKRYEMEKRLLSLVISHPDLLYEVVELLGNLNFTSVKLDRLRQEILQLSGTSGLDKEALIGHLSGQGCASALQELLQENFKSRYRPSEAASVDFRAMWNEAFRRYQKPVLDKQISEARETYDKSGSDEDCERWKLLLNQRNKFETDFFNEGDLGVVPGRN